jgi:hypothetical protein
MALAKTSISPIVSVTGVTTVGIYTNPASTKTYIKGFVLHNAGISSAFCRLHDVPDSGGSVGTASSNNQFFSQYINAGETTFLEYPYPLTLASTNHSIRFLNSVAGQVINIQILGDADYP